MENLQDHVFRPDITSENHKDRLRKFEPVTDFGDKIKAIKELPKRKAFVFLQTVRQNMEGFTRHEVKGARKRGQTNQVLSLR